MNTVDQSEASMLKFDQSEAGGKILLTNQRRILGVYLEVGTMSMYRPWISMCVGLL